MLGPLSPRPKPKAGKDDPVPLKCCCGGWINVQAPSGEWHGCPHAGGQHCPLKGNIKD